MLKNRMVRVVALLGMIALAAWYLARHWKTLRDDVRGFDVAYLLPLVSVHLVTLGLNGWVNRDLVKRLGVRLSVLEWYGLSAVTALGNYFPLPQAGAAARGVYLKRRHGLPYAPYAATVLFTYVFSLALLGAIGLLGLLSIHLSGGKATWPLWVAFGALTCLVFLLTPVASRLIPGRRLAALREGVAALAHPHTMLRLTVCKLVLIAVNATGIWLAYRSLGQHLSWAASLVLTMAAMASGVVNITPGNAGAAEMTAWVTARFLGSDPTLAVVVYLIYRATQALAVFTLGPLFLAALARWPGGGLNNRTGVADIETARTVAVPPAGGDRVLPIQ